MEKNAIIRKLVLVEENEEFYLEEYLQVNDKSVATGNHFRMEEVIGALVHSKKDLVVAENKEINGIDYFQFASNKGLRIEKKNQGNKDNRIKQLRIMIHEKLKGQENVDTFQEQLERIAIRVNQKTSEKHYKLIRKTTFVKAVGVATAVVLGGASLAHYVIKQQQLQNQQAISMMKQYDISNPTREELQKRYHEMQPDSIDLKLQEQVEENQKTKGMQ